MRKKKENYQTSHEELEREQIRYESHVNFMFYLVGAFIGLVIIWIKAMIG